MMLTGDYRALLCHESGRGSEYAPTKHLGSLWPPRVALVPAVFCAGGARPNVATPRDLCKHSSELPLCHVPGWFSNVLHSRTHQVFNREAGCVSWTLPND